MPFFPKTMDWTQMFEEAVTSVLNSVPKPDIYYTKVRKLDDCESRTASWKLVINDGPVKLYKNKDVLECLLNDRTVSEQTFSLFRYQNSQKAEQMFKLVTEKVPLLYKASSKCTNVEKLQAICDCLREHPDWSVAHIGIHVSAAGCFQKPDILM
ncbi:85/88 kDa calcium-independent phospholipase A2-like [Antedon mediterranea]|uniref:85/88 kDa calcium-independent phospholipase A2-like n=1 Tax=Antedon mediterranea TaxID=105859 RepID=UPI003AF502C7